jgi:hypothetical protein
VSMLRDVSGHCHTMKSMALFTFLTGLLLATFSPLSAQPAKAKEASTKPPAVAELKPEAPSSSAAANVAADPATCVKPGDTQAAQGPDDTKPSASSASATAGSGEAANESADQSNTEFMKDKLKLSLGGKKGPAPDEPLQCGVDEAGSQAKESDTASSK